MFQVKIRIGLVAAKLQLLRLYRMHRRSAANALSKATRGFTKREFKTAQRLLASVPSGSKATPSPPSLFSNTSTQKRQDDQMLLHPLYREVADQTSMQVFESELVNEGNIGLALAFPSKTPDPLRIFGIPKSVEKTFDLVTRPFSVVRRPTLSLRQTLENARKSGSDNRIVITGGAGTGKSYLLLQTIIHCVASNWIVLYLPRAIDTVNCTTPYNYEPRTQTFLQPMLSEKLLRQLRDMGHSGLKKLTLTNDFAIDSAPPGAPKKGQRLIELIEYGILEVSMAPFVLEQLLAELASQTQYPFLLAIDDFQALYSQSQYKTPQFEPIESFHLSVPRLLLEYACGSRKIHNGALLSALSMSNTSWLPKTEIYEALNLDLTHGKRPDAWDKRSEAYQHYAAGLKAFRMPERLEIKEAAGILDVMKNDRALLSDPSDQLFLSKYCESNGNPKEFVWRGLMATLDS
ncbi:SubName: Full=Uncharacterized protein {ECO:0000313/EMBL:CCA69094.1} [Serendipita indica DSM 11827]|nr:SubName: Full=Uncharacterized protein {ECO:0000313/EMBL:CCA69094.1} [Serendipita indica DSM 11827]